MKHITKNRPQMVSISKLYLTLRKKLLFVSVLRKARRTPKNNWVCSVGGRTVNVPNFNRETVEYASRERDESKPGIKTLRPFLKNITEET